MAKQKSAKWQNKKPPNGKTKIRQMANFQEKIWTFRQEFVSLQAKKSKRMKEYRKRIADDMLSWKLDALGAVLIEGPKACGKTTTAEQQAKSIVYMDDIEKKDQYRWLAENNIHKLLEGNTPRRIFPELTASAATARGR